MSEDQLPNSKNNNQFNRILFLIGALLVILGTFLPWECYGGGFFYFCSAGINFTPANLNYYNSDPHVMLIMISIGGSLIISGIEAFRQWRVELIGIFITSVILYFSIKNGIIYGTGGFITLFLTVISIWGVFRLARFNQRAIIVVTIATSSLVLVLMFYIIRTSLPQTLQSNLYLDSTLEFGLPVALVGSILMFAMRRNVIYSSRP